MSVTASQIYDEIGIDIENAIRDSTAQLIPTFSLTNEDLDRINRYFQTNLDFDEIVCIVSNSVLNIGKSGVVFTKDGFYYKGWMSFQIYHEYYFSYDSFVNDYNIFNKNLLREIMRNANEFIVIEERKEERWNAIMNIIGHTANNISNVIDIITYAGNIVMNIMRIFYISSTEETFCELYKLTGLAYRRPELFTIGDSVDYRLQLKQIKDFTDEIIDDLNKLKDIDIDYSEYHAKVLLLSVIASLLLIKTNPDAISIGSFFSSFDINGLISKLDEGIDNVNLDEYKLDSELVSTFVNTTFEYIANWETEDDYELAERGNVLVDGMITIINVIQTTAIAKNLEKTIEKIAHKKIYELYMDICVNNLEIQGKKIPDDMKKIIKICSKMKNKIEQADFSEIVKCAPYLDEQVKYFHKGMTGLLGMSSSFYDYPILSIILSDYFCSGIIVTNENVIWNYLPESPEAGIIKSIYAYKGQEYDEDELKEGESGYISLQDIKNISVGNDFEFVNLYIILNDNSEYFLPVSLLPVQCSESLCEIIQAIVGQITHQKFSKKERNFFLDDELRKQLENEVLTKYSLLSLENVQENIEKVDYDENKNILREVSDENINNENTDEDVYISASQNVHQSQAIDMTPENSNIVAQKEHITGIISLILGICSIPFSIVIIGAFFGIIGIILARISFKKKNYSHGIAKAGMITSIIGVTFSSLLLLLLLIV